MVDWKFRLIQNSNYNKKVEDQERKKIKSNKHVDINDMDENTSEKKWFSLKTGCKKRFNEIILEWEES